MSSLGYFIPSPLISTKANNRQGELDLYFGVELKEAGTAESNSDTG